MNSVKYQVSLEFLCIWKEEGVINFLDVVEYISALELFSVFRQIILGRKLLDP